MTGAALLDEGERLLLRWAVRPVLGLAWCLLYGHFMLLVLLVRPWRKRLFRDARYVLSRRYLLDREKGGRRGEIARRALTPFMLIAIMSVAIWELGER